VNLNGHHVEDGGLPASAEDAAGPVCRPWCSRLVSVHNAGISSPRALHTPTTSKMKERRSTNMIGFVKQSFERDRERCAFHEAGHVVAALALGLEADSRIWWTGKRPTREKKCVLGQTSYEKPRTPLEQAIIGWAGNLGEDYLFEKSEQEPDYSFELVWCDFDLCPETFSLTDRSHIGDGRLSGKAFEHAVEIINANRDMVDQCAQNLICSLRRDNPNPPPIDFSSMGCSAVLPARVAKSVSAKNSCESLPRILSGRNERQPGHHRDHR